MTDLLNDLILQYEHLVEQEADIHDLRGQWFQIEQAHGGEVGNLRLSNGELVLNPWNGDEENTAARRQGVNKLLVAKGTRYDDLPQLSFQAENGLIAAIILNDNLIGFESPEIKLGDGTYWFGSAMFEKKPGQQWEEKLPSLRFGLCYNHKPGTTYMQKDLRDSRIVLLVEQLMGLIQVIEAQHADMLDAARKINLQHHLDNQRQIVADAKRQLAYAMQRQDDLQHEIWGDSCYVLYMQQMDAAPDAPKVFDYSWHTKTAEIVRPQREGGYINTQYIGGPFKNKLEAVTFADAWATERGIEFAEAEPGLYL